MLSKKCFCTSLIHDTIIALLLKNVFPSCFELIRSISIIFLRIGDPLQFSLSIYHYVCLYIFRSKLLYNLVLYSPHSLVSNSLTNSLIDYSYTIKHWYSFKKSYLTYFCDIIKLKTVLVSNIWLYFDNYNFTSINWRLVHWFGRCYLFISRN